ncbi:LytTR family DNA-binding domain-containing protein [Frateuria defendens]|uniref:LytTR family DNA-binding domain-containing protein n=1 Tax=Frateuria defendens TaxID=2219559 RepID=UPI00066FDE01|nr:LytTR family DNA-binding domain-containing protein [Frateuria defendens]
MACPNRSSRLPRRRTLPPWLAESGGGFGYWLLFLIVLEPGNALRANAHGHALAAGPEALRMTVAALLGAAATPALLALTRRFPPSGPNALRRLPALALGVATLAFGLIVASCFLAAWGYHQAWLPSLADLRDQLIDNWLLLTYALLALAALAHFLRCLGSTREAAPAMLAAPAQPYLTRVPVKHRGRQSFVELDQVDWIETQGNYLALHTGTTSHLIREAAVAFEAKLDPARFMRVHRRAIVAIDRIRDLRPITNGDALLRLSSGHALRASRRYRKSIAERWRLDG